MPDDGMVYYKARILAAVPGTSQNNRKYTRETLQQMTPLYEDKPFILDHNIEDVEKVVGRIYNPRYGVEEGWDGKPYEGTWLNAVGMMPQRIFNLLKGKGPVGPLVRGVSIGGQGDGQYNTDGATLITNFKPAELSVTAFPGIQDAQIADISLITESARRSGLLNHGSMQPRMVSLDEAKRQAKRETSQRGMPIREGGPGTTNVAYQPSAPRPGIRGLNAVNDSGKNLKPDVQAFTRPAATTDMVRAPRPNPWNDTTGQVSTFQGIGADTYAGLKGQSSTEGAVMVSGYDAATSRDAKAWSPKIPSLGRTTTQSPGFGGMSPSGSGLQDQPGDWDQGINDSDESARVRAAVQSLMLDQQKVLYELRTGKPFREEADPMLDKQEEEEAKVDVSKPPSEEEEEERVLMRHLARMEMEEIDYDLGNQKFPIYYPTAGGTSMNDYQRTRNQLSAPGAVQGTISQQFWNPPNEGDMAAATGFDKRAMHLSTGRPAASGGSSADQNMPRESMRPGQPVQTGDEFVMANPVKSAKKGEEEEEEEERQRRARAEEKKVIANRLLQLRMKRLFPHEQGTAGKTGPGGGRPYTGAQIPKTPSLGNTTTKTPGFNKLSPSGTGLKDQSEEEEEERHKRAVENIHGLGLTKEQEEEEEEEEERIHQAILGRIGRHKEQDGSPSYVNKDPDKPSGEEEEERAPTVPANKLMPQGYDVGGAGTTSMNPLAKANPYARVAQNPVGDQQEEEERTVLTGNVAGQTPDIVPIEGRATAFPLGKPGLWDHFIRQKQASQEADVQRFIAGWNGIKQRPVQPLRKITVKTTESANPVAPRGSNALIPTLPGVPARGMMANNPTLAPSQPYQYAADARVRNSRLEQIAESVRKESGSYNLGPRIWRSALPEILEVQP